MTEVTLADQTTILSDLCHLFVCGPQMLSSGNMGGSFCLSIMTPLIHIGHLHCRAVVLTWTTYLSVSLSVCVCLHVCLSVCLLR